MGLENGERKRTANSLHPAHVCMVVDCSGSMSGGKLEQVNAAIFDLTVTMQSQNVGASGFRYLLSICKFGESVEEIVVAKGPKEINVDKLVFEADLGGTDISQGLEWAVSAVNKSLQRCREEIQNYQEELSPNVLALVLTDGELTQGGPVAGPAQALRSIPIKGGRVDVVAVGIDVDDKDFQVLEAIASRPNFAVRISEEGLAAFLSKADQTVLGTKSVSDLVSERR